MGLSRLEENRVGEALLTHSRICQPGSPLLVAQWESVTDDCAERVVSMKRQTAEENTLSAGKGDSKCTLCPLLCDSQSQDIRQCFGSK